ncbi:MULTISPECIES: MarR family winged helix-turn-helix transcriptional regulator [Neisseria]|uniref:MarR family protein n=1 Tax=Neisseria musculi TaxID=1815583 RepID=A0A7H1MB80_9NEIS|nr:MULTISPECIES: MarR family transcriptional regulator [Neisseria]MBF0804114.1 MarR family transcriptional regulator [Neisseria sp. 19428wB4_WF04]QNT58895.1 marR family protein [Neisseria musculi]TFU43132.1 MarR family transcriptional regulator [Neisseria sp. WF04]
MNPSPFDALAETCATLLDVYVRWAKQRGLSANEFFVLYQIGRHGSATPKEIGEEWHLPKQTVSFVCRQLAEKGWLRTEADPHDKRSKRLFLSEAGASRTLPMVAALHALETQTAELFGLEKLNQLIKQLQHLQLVFTQQAEWNHGNQSNR